MVISAYKVDPLLSIIESNQRPEDINQVNLPACMVKIRFCVDVSIPIP